MNLTKSFFFFLMLIAPLEVHSFNMIRTRSSLEKLNNRSDIVIIASTGRSGSSMLTSRMKIYAQEYAIYKTHLLPPADEFKGKILFIFSNPDMAAESALHLTLRFKSFGSAHFRNMETSDREWLQRIGDTTNQTIEDNLLSYDALGCYQHLEEWLHLQTTPCKVKEAQILAIKFENIWDPPTIQAIKEFLHIANFQLPPRRERGYEGDDLNEQEIEFRQKYNLGTSDQPNYAAYDKARIIWKNALPFQFLKIGKKNVKQQETTTRRKHKTELGGRP